MSEGKQLTPEQHEAAVRDLTRAHEMFYLGAFMAASGCMYCAKKWEASVQPHLRRNPSHVSLWPLPYPPKEAPSE